MTSPGALWRLLGPEAQRAAVRRALAAAIFVSALAMHLPRVDDHPWSGDEPHKIAETYFLRLLCNGDFGNRAWFGDRIARSNPPVGKVLFGLALLLAGEELPRDLSIQQELLASRGFTTSEATRILNVRRVHAARRASVVATAVSATVVLLLVSWAGGMLSGVLAAGIFLRHYVVSVYASAAVFDALLTALILLGVLSATAVTSAPSSRRRWLALFGTAFFSAAAFQTRLSGLVALPVALLVVFLADAGRSLRRRVLDAALIAGLTGAFALAMNHFYWWPAGDSAPALPVRIVLRFQQQIHDLAALLHGHSYEITTLQERAAFAAGILASGVAGKAMLAGTALMIAFLLSQSRSSNSRERALGWSAVLLSVVVLAWLPMRWDRYLEPVIAMLAVSAGLGLDGLLRGAEGWLRSFGGRRQGGG